MTRLGRVEKGEVGNLVLVDIWEGDSTAALRLEGAKVLDAGPFAKKRREGATNGVSECCD